jgi:hypothetical protein
MAGNECLQYYTGTTGSFSSFNYDTAGTTVPTITQQQHLASQDYSICFRSLLLFFFFIIATRTTPSGSGPSYYTVTSLLSGLLQLLQELRLISSQLSGLRYSSALNLLPTKPLLPGLVHLLQVFLLTKLLLPGLLQLLMHGHGHGHEHPHEHPHEHECGQEHEHEHVHLNVLVAYILQYMYEYRPCMYNDMNMS